MENIMEMRLSVIDEERDIIAVMGIFSMSDMENIIECAQENNLYCLQFVSLAQDTHFNERQQFLMDKDISFLRQQPKINKAILDLIERGAIIARTDSGFSQLKFEPIDRFAGLEEH